MRFCRFGSQWSPYACFGNELYEQSSKDCYIPQKKKNGFGSGTTWGWVHNEFFIFDCYSFKTIPLQHNGCLSVLLRNRNNLLMFTLVCLYSQEGTPRPDSTPGSSILCSGVNEGHSGWPEDGLHPPRNVLRIPLTGVSISTVLNTAWQSPVCLDLD